MQSKMRVSVLSALAVATLGAGLGSAAARTDVPIRQIVMPDGAIRYTVPITVGDSAPVEAILDTGSFGLRVLAGAVKPGSAAPTGERRALSFSGGVKFEGSLDRAVIGVGAARTDRPALAMVIDHVSCVSSMPNCYAGRVKQEDYRIAGGEAKQGFEAILGIALRGPASGDGAVNPLSLMGAERWIVSLPRPGSAETGHLIVDPDPDETAAFALIHLKLSAEVSGEFSGWADSSLPGCLVGEGEEAPLCTATVLDTGNPNFAIGTADVSEPRPYGAGKSVRFEIGGAAGPVSMPFITGRDTESRVVLLPLRDGRKAKMITGPLPFLSYDVLYDAKSGTMGFKRRETASPE